MAVIGVLRGLFARFGLPETVVTDNGTGFVSQEFEEFLSKNRISHVTSAPYHPASNGLAERASPDCKERPKEGDNWQHGHSTGKSALFLSHHTPKHHWVVSIRTTASKEAPDTVRSL